MVVCKFFQEGYCRYGQNCRFEHIYGSKYTYNAQPASQSQPQQSGVTDEQLVQQVQTDVQAALKGNQWLYSCYAPFKEKPVYPGLSDLSPEEARLFIYEAKANNTVDQAVAYMNNLSQQTRAKYEQLLLNTPGNVKLLRSLYKGESLASPFGQTQSAFNSQSQGNSASSLFRSAVQTNNTSPFAQNTAQSLFAQAASNTANSSPFGNDPAKSIFSQATQNVFGSPQQNQSNFFGADTAKSLFAEANSSPFGTTSAAQTAQPFKSPFEQPSPFAQNSGNVFQKTDTPTNIFGQAAQLPSADDMGVYSNQNALSPEDLEMFQTDSFKLGFIPEVPPPHSLCV